MSLEKELDEIPSTEKSSNINNYFYGAVFIGTILTIGYLCVQIGQYVLEQIEPNLPNPSMYVPFF